MEIRHGTGNRLPAENAFLLTHRHDCHLRAPTGDAYKLGLPSASVLSPAQAKEAITLHLGRSRNPVIFITLSMPLLRLSLPRMEKATYQDASCPA